jgi:hypothetical protein
MPQYKVSVELITFIDAETPDMARRIAQDTASDLVSFDERAERRFEERHPQDVYPGFSIGDINAEDGQVYEDALKNSKPVSQEELDKPAEVV